MAGVRPYRTELSPVSFLRRSAYAFPGKVAVVHGARHTTYRELDERANRLASALSAAGIERGDRVAFLAPNIPAMLEAHFGVPAAGAVLVAINTRLGRDEIALHPRALRGAHGLRRSRARATSSRAPGLPTIRIDDTGAARRPVRGLPRRRLARAFRAARRSTRRTRSRSTTPRARPGSRRASCTRYRGAYLNALGEALHSNLAARSVYLWIVPMFHCNGWCFTWAVTAVGGAPRLPAQGRSGAMWELIEREGVTHFNGAPTVLLGSPRTRPRTAVERGAHRHDRRRPALADAARADGGAELPRSSTSTG